VASFGQNLRQAREARNITLQEVAATTKVSSRALQALEDERFDLLPGGIFNKGFVRAYARCVGLDEEKTVAAYLEAAKLATPEIDMQTMSSQVSAARQGANERGPSAATVVGVVALIVALAMGAVWLKEQWKESRERAAAQQSAESSGTKTTAPAPIPVPPVATNEPATGNQTGGVGQGAALNVPQNVPQNAAQSASQNTPQNTSQSANQSANPVAASSGSKAGAEPGPSAPVEISISATARAWISVRSDGKTVETLTLDPEKPEARTRSYKAKEKLTLVVGNPAGLSVTYNGKPAGTLGVEGHPATITFTPRGIEKQ
jgi:cytoskeleton protein RodZ